MDELNQLDYSEWLHWCGYTDAEMYSWPLDNDPAYMAGFAEGYARNSTWREVMKILLAEGSR
jgi:hypothetical protein